MSRRATARSNPLRRFYSRTAEVENAVVADFWTALSRIAAAARAMAVAIRHAATKLRIVVLRDVMAF
jgi:hypothetical protein